MSDAAAPVKAAKKKASKPKAPADHPKYHEMIKEAITALKERGGSSRQAICKYICANFKVSSEQTKVNSHVKSALKAGVKNGTLKQAKGKGASGSFRVGESKKAAKPKVKKTTKASKPAKAKKPKAAAAKKPAADKKAKKPKAKKPKSPKKAAAAKPKKPKSPKKKSPAKPKAKKAAKPKKAATKK